MSDPITASPPAVDLTSAAFRDDPFPTYRRLRHEAPVAHLEELGVWALSRHADVKEALRDTRRFSNEPGEQHAAIVDAIGPGDLLNLDPPRHGRTRRLVQGSFAPRALAALEPAIRAETARLLAPILERREGDMAGDLAWPLAVSTIATLLGLPRADVSQLTGWVRALDEPGATMPTLRRMREYVDGVLAGAGPGVIGEIRAASAGGRLGGDEAAGLTMGLVLAGTATVACLIANGLLVLVRHADQLARLRTGEVGAAAAVEELLRFESPVQILPRRTTESVVLGGATVPREATVLLLLGSANRDERRFERADDLDLARGRQGSVAFGGGIHFCVGAALARLEARIAFAELLTRAAEIGLAGEPVRIPSSDVRGLWQLPVHVRPVQP